LIVTLFTPAGIVVVVTAATAPLVLAGPAAASTTPTTVRVSVPSSGGEANGRSRVDAITPDGRFVLFDSWATNLVRGDTNVVRDVYLRDRKLGRTVRVSVGVGGRQANGPSRGVAVSGDGRFVLFVSDATDLTGQADRNHNVDVFVRNLLRGKTFRVGVRPGGGQFFDNRYGGLDAVGISDSGRWVAFAHYTPYQPTGCCAGWGTFIRDRARHTTRRIGAHTTWVRSVLPLALSPDGRWLILGRGANFGFALDDLATGHVRQVGYALSDFGGLTPDARYIAYDVGNAVGGSTLIRWDRLIGTRRVLVGGTSFAETAVGISADGGYVAFSSENPNLVGGDTNGTYTTDLFGYDLATQAVTRLDLTSTGAEIRAGIPFLHGAVLASGGRWAAFTSRGGRVVPGDTNHAADVFVRGPLP
jgi:Tol biopolymer transport system component